jgi:hypothetical protein
VLVEKEKEKTIDFLALKKRAVTLLKLKPNPLL